MTDDNNSISTLSREDALTLECEDTEEEFRLETFIVEVSDDEAPEYSDTETENFADDEGEDEDAFWPTDEEIAAMEAADALWRNPDAYYYDSPGYDPAGEI
jgi:hypothetical protein